MPASPIRIPHPDSADNPDNLSSIPQENNRKGLTDYTDYTDTIRMKILPDDLCVICEIYETFFAKLS